MIHPKIYNRFTRSRQRTVSWTYFILLYTVSSRLSNNVSNHVILSKISRRAGHHYGVDLHNHPLKPNRYRLLNSL